MKIRRPAVAGMFYPSGPDDLRVAIADAFSGAVRSGSDTAVPKALVVPHAGYVYSGAVAASAYLRLEPARAAISRVVLLGPSHRVYLDAMALPADDVFTTPLGAVEIDAELRDEVRLLPTVVVHDEPHRQEHSLEVQLPFLQTVLDEFTLLPFSVGDVSTDAVAGVLDAVWGGPETLIVISTDLSHFLSYEEACSVDGRTAAAIVAGEYASIGDRDACGSRGLRGMLRVAAQKGLAIEQLDVRNSGDTAGDHSRVVGYGSFAIG